MQLHFVLLLLRLNPKFQKLTSHPNKRGVGTLLIIFNALFVGVIVYLIYHF